MRLLAIWLSAIVCLATLGGAIVAAPPNRVPPAPPSAVVKVVDHLPIQPGQEMSIPVDVTGWQEFTLFYEAIMPPPDGTVNDQNRCAYVGGLNGLGDNLAPIVVGTQAGTAMCVNSGSPQGTPQKGFLGGGLIGPDFVVTVGGTADLETPATVDVWIYLH